MCGILGELVSDKKLICKDKFLNMLAMSGNRGPDNTGYINYNNKLQFGFNRLSIIDLSEVANQPIYSKDGRYIMVYNGEVYNYLSIRKDLEEQGVKFISKGDSEVLVEAFSKYGIEKTVSIIDGMFAIGLFDKKLKTTYLIRDHAGIKPLHYGYNKKTLVFASQYNQVAQHPSFKDNQLDSNILKLFFEQHFIPAPYGLLKETYQVMPGEIITFCSNGSIQRARYWELPKQIEPSIHNRDEAINLISESLMKSVSMQLASDVPIGSFLSGGVDSSLICSFMKGSVKQGLKTFTIGSDSEKYDESKDAKTFAKIIGMKNKNYFMDSHKALNNLEDIMKSITEPFADISIFPTYMVSKLAKREVKVCLSGDGGDELFYGYERFWSVAKNIKVQYLFYYIKYLLYGLDKVFSNNERINSLCLYAKQATAHYSLHNRFSENILKGLAPELNNLSPPQDYLTYDYPNTNSESQLLNYMRYAEFYGMMQKTLKKVDQASMNNSLEVRVPFLNKKFIEDSLKIDPYLNYGPNYRKKSKRKTLLIDILKKSHPQKTLDGKKRGFSVPLQKWITDDLLEPMSDVIIDKNLIQYFGINENELKKIITEHRNGTDHKWPIFTIFSLFSWKNNLSA